jgi:hypothetical protein
MSLYKFHINGSKDAAELELSDDREAWREAVAATCELLKDNSNFGPEQEWLVEVRSEERLVFRLTVSGR